MWSQVAIPVLILTGLGLGFAAILALAYKKLAVEEDPRLDLLEEMLPNANCGACGSPGCRAFAERLIKGNANPSLCTVGSEDEIASIASFLGVKAEERVKEVARLLCAGGKAEAHNRAGYAGGLKTCRGEAVVAGGPKECTWGCLGLGDCESACDFDAIRMNEDALPLVDPAKCTACGDCVEACPKDLFVLMPVDHRLLVQCKSQLEGDLATDACSVACNACGRCALDAAPGLIEIREGLARIDYSKEELLEPSAIRRCPTGAIVWLEGPSQFKESKKEKHKPGNMRVPVFDEGRYYQ